MGSQPLQVWSRLKEAADSMSPKRIMTIFGTRPEAVKMAPVIKELERHGGEFEPLVVVTAQHREMLDQILDHFRIEPRHDLNIMKPRQTLAEIATRALEGLDEIIAAERPDMVLVHGDTATTFAGSLAAFYNRVPAGHVEAGLRTGDKYSPYPEEMNRKLTGALVDLHFAPTEQARANLRAEAVPEDRIFVTGNTAIDALFMTVRKDYRFADDHLNRLDFGRRKVVVVDCLHRRENFGDKMASIYRGIRRIARECPDVQMVVALHKNPEAREVALEVLGDVDPARVFICEPMDYPEWVNLISRAYLVISDSGGVQEEAPSLGAPVLLLRETTERPEAIEAGTVKMVGTDEERIVAETERLLRDEAEHRRMARARNPYGDGHAAERIAGALAKYFYH